MKKRSYFLLLFFALSLLVLPQSITVTEPHSGGDWKRNVHNNMIRWSASGEMNNKVKIRLYNWEGRTKIKDIVNETENDGAYRCPPTIFNDIPDGEYIIRIKTIDNGPSGDSGIFTIGELLTTEPNNPYRPLPPPESLKKNLSAIKKRKIPRSIIITFPPKDHVWDLRLGDKGIPFPIYVMWKKIGNWNDIRRVHISLMRVTVPASIGIADNIANNGLFTGEIKRMDYGNKLLNPYKIVICTPHVPPYKVYVQSPIFYIRNDVYRLD